MNRFLLIILALFILLSCQRKKKIVTVHPNGYYKEVYHVVDDSIREGSYMKYYENDILADSCHYVADKIHGTRKIFNPEGYLEIEENYQNGIFHGPYTTYYPNGQAKKIQEYVNNRIQGMVKEFYPDGQLKAEVSFVDNLENGPFVEYFENGNKHWEGFYQDGDFEQDTLKEFDQQGELIRKMFCNKGICQTVWTPDEGYVEPEEIFIHQ